MKKTVVNLLLQSLDARAAMYEILKTGTVNSVNIGKIPQEFLKNERFVFCFLEIIFAFRKDITIEFKNENGDNAGIDEEDLEKEIDVDDDLEEGEIDFLEFPKKKIAGDEKKEIAEEQCKTLNIANLYFKQIKEKRISSEETLNFFMEIERLKEQKSLNNNDEIEEKILSIRQRIVEGNLPLSVWWAWKHIYFTRYSNLTFLDLIQLGNMGLMKAAERFDVYRGFQFSTYAVWWIDQYIHRKYIDEGSTIRKPVNVIQDLRKINNIEKRFLKEFGKIPTAEETVEIAKISVKQVRNIKKMIFKEPVSLDAPLFDKKEKERKLADFISCSNSENPEKIFEELELKQKIEDVLNILSEKEKKIIKFRFYDDMTLEEIGEIFDLSRERVRQIEKIVLGKLRKPSVLEKILKIYPADINVSDIIKEFGFNRPFAENNTQNDIKLDNKIDVGLEQNTIEAIQEVKLDNKISIGLEEKMVHFKQKKEISIKPKKRVTDYALLLKATKIRREILNKRLEQKNK